VIWLLIGVPAALVVGLAVNLRRRWQTPWALVFLFVTGSAWLILSTVARLV
jgi:hypothetical protein